MDSPANMNAKMGITTQNRIYPVNRENIRPSQSFTGSGAISRSMSGICPTISPDCFSRSSWMWRNRNTIRTIRNANPSSMM